jgi:hypothetical protein
VCFYLGSVVVFVLCTSHQLVVVAILYFSLLLVFVFLYASNQSCQNLTTAPHVLRVHPLKTRVEVFVQPVLLASTVTLQVLQDVLRVQQALTTHPLVLLHHLPV